MSSTAPRGRHTIRGTVVSQYGVGIAGTLNGTTDMAPKPDSLPLYLHRQITTLSGSQSYSITRPGHYLVDNTTPIANWRPISVLVYTPALASEETSAMVTVEAKSPKGATVHVHTSTGSFDLGPTGETLRTIQYCNGLASSDGSTITPVPRCWISLQGNRQFAPCSTNASALNPSSGTIVGRYGMGVATNAIGSIVLVSDTSGIHVFARNSDDTWSWKTRLDYANSGTNPTYFGRCLAVYYNQGRTLNVITSDPYPNSDSSETPDPMSCGAGIRFSGVDLTAETPKVDDNRYMAPTNSAGNYVRFPTNVQGKFMAGGMAGPTIVAVAYDKTTLKAHLCSWEVDDESFLFSTPGCAQTVETIDSYVQQDSHQTFLGSAAVSDDRLTAAIGCVVSGGSSPVERVVIFRRNYSLLDGNGTVANDVSVGQWSEVQTISVPTDLGNCMFGFSLSLNGCGDLMAVGARHATYNFGLPIYNVQSTAMGVTRLFELGCEATTSRPLLCGDIIGGTRTLMSQSGTTIISSEMDSQFQAYMNMVKAYNLLDRQRLIPAVTYHSDVTPTTTIDPNAGGGAIRPDICTESADDNLISFGSDMSCSASGGILAVADNSYNSGTGSAFVFNNVTVVNPA